MALTDNIGKYQKAWLLGLALVIILMSVVTTLWLRGALFSSWGSVQGYQNVTLTDAVITCEAEARSVYKSRLQRLTLDNLSSRYDKGAKLYRVFFAADVQLAKGSPNSQFLVSCLVGAKRGNITDFEAFEKKEAASEAIERSEGGIFGWPM